MTVRTLKIDAGFTLIEALVVLAIAALAFALVPGTIRAGHQALRAAAAAEQRHADRQAATSLSMHLSGARPVRVTGADGVSNLAFEGASDRVRFVTEFAAGPSGGGLYLVDVGIEPGTTNLIVSYQAFPGDREATSVAGQAVLMQAETLSMRYFGIDSKAGGGTWRQSWSRMDHLPNLVEIVITPLGGTSVVDPVLVAIQLARSRGAQ